MLAETTEAKAVHYNSHTIFLYAIEEANWTIIFGIQGNGVASSILMRLKYVFMLTGVVSMVVIIITSLYIVGNWGKIAGRYAVFSSSIAQGDSQQLSGR